MPDKELIPDAVTMGECGPCEDGNHHACDGLWAMQKDGEIVRHCTCHSCVRQHWRNAEYLLSLDKILL